VNQENNPEINSAFDSRSSSLLQSRSLATEIAQLADDRHCSDIVILELADRSPVANHFVIATGTSDQQLRSVAREMEDLGKQNNFKVFSRAGMQQGRWAVVDFVDVVVHLFDEEFRKFYDLELLWGDAPKITWQRDKNFATEFTESTENFEEKD
jgi:ribosome-associated protein